MPRALVTLCLLLAGCPSSPLPPPVAMPTFPRRATVVFLGDSITWDHHFIVLLEAHVRRRHPASTLRFVNRGVRGDTVRRALARLDDDVIAERPQMVLVLLGINDGGYRGPDRRRLRRYLEEMRLLIDRLRRETRARIVLLTTTTVLPSTPRLARYREMLSAMAVGLIDLGRREGVAVVDLFSFFSAKLRRAAAARPPIELMADANHPNRAGHLLIAARLLQALDPDGLRSRRVQRIDLSSTPPPTTVTLSHPHDNIFLPPQTRRAATLLDRGWPLGRALAIVGVPGPLRLGLGGHPLGTFDRAALAAGIDLDLLDQAPWVREARKLHDLLVRRGKVERLLRRCSHRPCPTPTERQDARRRLKRLRRSLARPFPRPQTYRLGLEPAGPRSAGSSPQSGDR